MSVFKGMVLGPVVHLPYIQKQTGRHEVNASLLQRVSGSDVRPSRGGKSSSKGRPYMLIDDTVDKRHALEHAHHRPSTLPFCLEAIFV